MFLTTNGDFDCGEIGLKMPLLMSRFCFFAWDKTSVRTYFEIIRFVGDLIDTLGLLFVGLIDTSIYLVVYLVFDFGDVSLTLGFLY